MRLKEEVIRALTAQGKLYEVGGTVRDSLLVNQPASKDIDLLVTRIPYAELCSLLRQYGKVDLVGRSFGVIKFTQRPNGSGATATFDFVLPRREFSIGSGHRDFEVDFDHNLPIESDLGRRDFTINAIARDVISGEYIDPLDGRADLKSKLIRYTSSKSFIEDPLRMLRAIQFAARFEFRIEEKTYGAICDNAGLIETISNERIAEELNKLLTRSNNPSIGFKLLHQTGMMKFILPELEKSFGVDQPGPYHKHPVFEHSIYTVDAAPKRLVVRMAALLHDIAKPQTKHQVENGATFYGHEVIGARITKTILERLRYSNEFIIQVATLVEKHMFNSEVSDKGVRRLIRKVGKDLIFDLLDLRRADVVAQGMGGSTDDVDRFEQQIREELERKPPFGLADLDVNGRDIMREFGLPEGKLVGEALNYLLEGVLDVPENNKYGILIEEARRFLNAKS